MERRYSRSNDEELSPAARSATMIPIHSYYILDGTSGISLFSKNFSGMELNEDLLTGLFRAMDAFIGHLAYSSSYPDSLREIIFGNSIIAFDKHLIENGNKLVGVVIAHKETPPIALHSFNQDALARFYQKYSPHLVHFSGNTNAFNSFKEDIEGLLRLKYSYLLKPLKLKNETGLEKSQGHHQSHPQAPNLNDKIDYWLNIAKFAGMGNL